jgi:transmembrane sensor
LQTARLVKAAKSPGLKWPKTSAETLIREAKASANSVLPFSRARSTASATGGELRRPGNRRVWAAAAVLLLGAGLTVFMLQRPKEFATAVGEQRSVLLADGSRMTLNTASKVEVTLRRNRREVRLVQGEALFEVAHDTARPFVVRAGTALLTDLGTLFNVDLRSTAATITVVEGRVDVESAGESADSRGGQGADEGSGTVILGPNERVVVTPTGIGAPQRGINVAASVAWTQRQLMFEHRPLSEVAEEFNRYNKDRIEIASDELKSQEVTGVFEAKDPGSFVAFLSNIPGVEIRAARDGSHIVILHKTQGGQR